MKIADRVVEIIENNEYVDFYSRKEDVIIPKLDHEFCHYVIFTAGKKESKGFGWYKRELECNRVAQALEADNRFEKFIHITGRKAYRYINGSKTWN